MKTLKQASFLVLQVILLVAVSGCVSRSSATGPTIEDAPFVESPAEEVEEQATSEPAEEPALGGAQLETSQISVPSSAEIAPGDILDQVVFMGTGGEEGIGCPCVYVENDTLYLEGFDPNQSLRLVAYDEYQDDFGHYYAEWEVTVDSSGYLTVLLDGYQSNITFIAYDPSSGKQKGPANVRVYPYEGTPASTSYAWISDEVTEVNLRVSPGYSNKDESQDVITKIPSGVPVEILDGPVSADGLDWWYVAWDGMEGYIADHTGSGRTILIFP